MALLASGVGKMIWKVSLLTVLSEPKSRIATDLLPCVKLYTNAPRHVNVAFVQVELLNDTYAVGMPPVLLPEVGDTLITNVLPPAVYPAPVTSLEVV